MARKIQDTFIKELTEEEQEVYSLFREIQNGLISEKLEDLEDIVTEDCRFVHLNGKPLSRDEYFSDIREDRVDFSSIELHKVQVLIVPDIIKDSSEQVSEGEISEGEVREKDSEETAPEVSVVENEESQLELDFRGDAHATLTCVTKTKAKLYGMSRVFTLHTVAEFIRRDGKWKCAALS